MITITMQKNNCVERSSGNGEADAKPLRVSQIQRFAKQPRILGAVEKLLRARTMIAKVDIWQPTLE